MKRNVLNILLSVVVGGFFLWLSLRNIDLSELIGYVHTMNFVWLIPFYAVALLSFWLRSERWKLILESEHPGIRSSTLFEGVVLGYLVNYAVPRLGELTRCVYVSQKEGTSGSNLLGTVVLERVIDLIAILLLVVMVMFLVVSDRQTLDSLFGSHAVFLLDELRNPWVFISLIVVGIISLILFWRACVFILEKRKRELNEGREIKGVFRIISMFTDGLVSLRKLKRWPRFLFFSVGIWVCYTMLTWLPFYAFGMVQEYNLGIVGAVSVMTIATIGVMLPSPGAVGTYHWFVKQTLFVLFAVPAVTGLAYAFVAHAAMLFSVLLTALAGWIFVIINHARRAIAIPAKRTER